MKKLFSIFIIFIICFLSFPLAGQNETTQTIVAGDYVLFGHYPQTASGKDKSSIAWQVLQTRGNKALLLSKYGLAAKPYNEEYRFLGWSDCSLRTWLNNSFLHSAFNKAEIDIISSTNVNNSPEHQYEEWTFTYYNDNTQDQVFLLSVKEASDYLGITSPGEVNKEASVTPTGFTSQYTNEESWWLRSNGPKKDEAATINKAGALSHQKVDNTRICVRPAIWVNTDSDLITKVETSANYILPADADRSVKIINDHPIIFIGKQVKLKTNIDVLKEGAPSKSALDWISYDESIATVDQKGTVKGVGVGTAEIQCSIRDNPSIKAFISIQVINPITKITSNEKKLVLFCGQTKEWKTAIEPRNATIQTLSYSSDNSEIASINEAGEITGISPGKAKITASSSDSSDKKCTLNLEVEPANPLEVKNLEYDTDGSGQIKIEINNNCLFQSLVNFRVDAYLYDKEGKLIQEKLYNLEKKASIKPQSTQKIQMIIPNNPDAKKYEFVVSGLYLTDGTYYSIPIDFQKTWMIPND